ncbi:MAG: methionine adenosyltransferase, partial [Proteobacteria bacterium]|nr:methionine adenosyltransferase [Pseudomonadota bacterium]
MPAKKASSASISTDPDRSLQDFVFTSESVAEGHPDKICDQISDAILDHYMTKDENCRTAIECMATKDYLGIFGEARGPSSITRATLEEIARKKIKDIGYDQEGFHWKTIRVDIHVHSQSADIAMGVDGGGKNEEGAGDQGIMFGYA